MLECKNCESPIDSQQGDCVHCPDCGWFEVDGDIWKPVESPPEPKPVEPEAQPEPTLDEQAPEPEPESGGAVMAAVSILGVLLLIAGMICQKKQGQTQPEPSEPSQDISVYPRLS